MEKFVIYLLFIFTLISVGLAVENSLSKCPSPNTIHPCYCEKDTDKIILTCENITDDDDLKTAMTSMKTQVDSKFFYRFELMSAFLRYLPGDLFEGTSIESLYIFDSGMLALSDDEYAFKGLEDSLIIFRVHDCTYVNHWDWTQLKRLKKIGHMSIRHSNMLEISGDFMDVTSKWPLESLYLGENNIKHIPPKAFSKLEKLEQLYLDSNSLKSVERSMFPNPAKYLYSLGLKNNAITALPIDIFHEMPSLESLYLLGNPIMVLEEQTFKPVWNNLSIVYLGDTLICDCRMSWITWMPRKHKGHLCATCNTPPRLRGRNPADLKKEDFKC